MECSFLPLLHPSSIEQLYWNLHKCMETKFWYFGDLLFRNLLLSTKFVHSFPLQWPHTSQLPRGNEVAEHSFWFMESTKFYSHSTTVKHLDALPYLSLHPFSSQGRWHTVENKTVFQELPKSKKNVPRRLNLDANYKSLRSSHGANFTVTKRQNPQKTNMAKKLPKFSTCFPLLTSYSLSFHHINHIHVLLHYMYHEVRAMVI